MSLRTSSTETDRNRSQPLYSGGWQELIRSKAPVIASSFSRSRRRNENAPFGKRPFRVHIDPTQDGAEVAFGVIDRVRTEMLHRVGLDELLTPVKN